MDNKKHRPELPSVYGRVKSAAQLIAIPFFFASHFKDLMPDSPPETGYWHTVGKVLSHEWIEKHFIGDRKPLSEVEQWKLTLIELDKGPMGARHEFCVATLERVPSIPTEKNTFYIRCDRFISNEAIDASASGSSAGSSSGPISHAFSKAGASATTLRSSATSSSSQDVDRTDRVSVLSKEECDASRKRAKSKVQRRIVFDKTSDDCPTILDLAVIVETYSKAVPQYSVWTSMCFWAAGTTLDVLRETRGGVHTEVGKDAGMWMGTRMYGRKNNAPKPSFDSRAAIAAELQANKTNESPQPEEVIRRDLGKVPSLDALVQMTTTRLAEVRAILAKNKHVAVVEQERDAQEKRADTAEKRADKAEKGRDTANKERDTAKEERDAAVFELAELKAKLGEGTSRAR